MRKNKDNIQTDEYAVSKTYGPNDPEFFNSIEEGIRPIVMALIAKGYYPISSCEGHRELNYYYVPHVYVAVASKEIPDFYDNVIKPTEFLWKQCPYHVCFPEDYMKQLDEDGTRRNMTRREAIDCINGLYDTNHENFVLIYLPLHESIMGMLEKVILNGKA